MSVRLSFACALALAGFVSTLAASAGAQPAGEREKILPVPQSAYSAAVKTQGGTLVFLGGIEPIDDKGELVAPGDFVGQIDQVWKNLDRAMAMAGGTHEDIVTMTVYTTERRWNTVFTGMRRDYFKDGYPSSAFVEARKLKTPGALVEIRAIAVLNK
jgi:enamine deaminase RidA (YjgF/YER057c/UK114 family)